MENKSVKNTNSELPPDILQLIFSKLPFSNLPTCRLVSKSWNNLVLSCKFDPSISISDFFVVQFYSCRGRNLHCVEFDPQHLKGMSTVASFTFHHPDFSSGSSRISIINSCTGLLSFVITKRRRRGFKPIVVCVLNPMTNEYFKLPTFRSKGYSYDNYFYGLGFNPRTKQYKLARCLHFCDAFNVDIFAFGTSSEWTPVGSLPYFINECHGVYFNGGLYWVGFQELFKSKAEQFTDVIYRLDLEDEKFEQIFFPLDGGDGDIVSSYIGVYNGALYLTLCYKNFEFYVWKMEEDFSWIKEFVLATPENLHSSLRCYGTIDCQLQLIKPCEDGNILCLLAGLQLILYDPKTKTMEVLTDQDFEIEKSMSVHQIDSFNFNSLHNILAGKC